MNADLAAIARKLALFAVLGALVTIGAAIVDRLQAEARG